MNEQIDWNTEEEWARYDYRGSTRHHRCHECSSIHQVGSVRRYDLLALCTRCRPEGRPLNKAKTESGGAA